MIYDVIETFNTIINNDDWYATMLQSTETCTGLVVNQFNVFSVVGDSVTFIADVQEPHNVSLSWILYHTYRLLLVCKLLFLFHCQI